MTRSPHFLDPAGKGFLGEPHMRFSIVSIQSSDTVPGYRGMDRPTLGSLGDVPESIVRRGMALGEAPPDVAEILFTALLADIVNSIGVSKYELVRLGGVEGPRWELLGYDVGELTERAWSAIVHWDLFLTPRAWMEWESRLNGNKLFPNEVIARQFLDEYLKSEDPDRGWTVEGWEEQPDIYAAIPVYRYR